jgi:hypothetical protein
MWSLGRGRLKIQEASEDFTKGGILSPSSKTSYFEENTKTDEENEHFSTKFALKRLGAWKKRWAHEGGLQKRLTHGKMLGA